MLRTEKTSSPESAGHGVTANHRFQRAFQRQWRSSSLSNDTCIFQRFVKPSVLLKLESLDDDLNQIGDQNTEGGESSTRTIERVNRDDFKGTYTIGIGSFAEVKVVRRCVCGEAEELALKALAASKIDNEVKFLQAALDIGMEAKILSELENDNIVRLKGICSSPFSYSYGEGTDEGYFLIMELLRDVLKDKLKRWRKWSFVNRMVNVQKMYVRMREVALGIARGMTYLHEKGYVMRDVKPSNIGFDGDGNVRIFDFGLCRRLEECNSDEVCGTDGYMAPEVWSGGKYDFKVDVYSFGIVLYELCSLTLPPFTKNEKKQLNDFNRITCPQTKSLIEKCRDADPNSRPSFAEICEEIGTITGYNDNKDEVASSVPTTSSKF